VKMTETVNKAEVIRVVLRSLLVSLVYLNMTIRKELGVSCNLNRFQMKLQVMRQVVLHVALHIQFA